MQNNKQAEKFCKEKGCRQDPKSLNFFWSKIKYLGTEQKHLPGHYPSAVNINLSEKCIGEEGW